MNSVDPSPGSEGDSDVLQWFVLKVQSNREKSIRDNLLRRIKREGLEDSFGEIVIPTEKVAESKSGVKRIFERKLFPGYIMVQMKLNDETWFLVRETPGVGDFTGAAGKPSPMRDEDVQQMLVKQEEKKETPGQTKIKIEFASGDKIKIKEGMFQNFDAVVDSVDELTGHVKVLVEIFGRSTSVELMYYQVEAV